MGKTTTIDLEDPEALAAHSRRAFLTRGAAGAAVAVAGGAALTALAASPAAAAAADVVLITPTRIYDSRPGQPFGGGGDGAGTIFTRGNAARRVLFGTDAGGDIVPEDATGVFINIAITNTVSTGALGFTAGSVATPPTASAINWFGASQILANMVLIPADPVATGGKLNANIAAVQAHVVAGTAGVSATHFIVDCFGYVAGS